MEKELKIITYNIDGLPDKLDLNVLPWIFKPFVWIYKWLKKTTVIKINDNSDISEKMKRIGQLLMQTNADIIGIQEDFNYHNELMESLKNDYNNSTYTGGFDLSKIFSNIECFSHFPFPRFKIDGLNLISKKETIKLNCEEIVKWKKSYGYIDHANDLLIHKGFRYYDVNVNDEFSFNLYLMHMDADFYDELTCPDVSKDVDSRISQFQQLTKHIENVYRNINSNPTVIIGDTNCCNKYQWDVDAINNFLINSINEIDDLEIKEATASNYIDKIFVINSSKSDFELSIKESYFDSNFKSLSDHLPLIATVKIWYKYKKMSSY